MEASAPQDPRSKNTWFNTSSPAAYLEGYRAELNRALSEVDGQALQAACDTLDKVTSSGGHVYAIGNGGSAAIADHLCCDWTKGTHCPPHKSMKTHSLSANSALLLAAANDFGFENSFSKQVEFYVTSQDLLVAISSSGNSENIIRAVELAKSRGAKVIGLSGFKGGKLHESADISLFVPSNNYGIVEDSHQSLMHVMAQFLVSKRENR